MSTSESEMTLVAEMATMVSHEVKAPLAGVGAALQILKDRLSAGTEEHAIIVEILERLRLLDERLDTLLLYAWPIKPRTDPLPIAGLVREVSERLCSHPDFSGLDVVVEGDQVVEADARLLDVALAQLLLNAMQASAGKGRIAVSIRSSGNGRGQCVVEVSDDGPGVPSELADKVFAPFFTTRPSGVGLGLTIARRIAEAHGGSLSLHARSPGAVARLELALCTRILD